MTRTRRTPSEGVQAGTSGYDPSLQLKRTIDEQYPNLTIYLKRLQDAGCTDHVILMGCEHIGVDPNSPAYTAIPFLLQAWREKESYERST